MSEDAALLSLADQTLWVTALIAGPVLVATLVVGLVVGIILAVTALVFVVLGAAMMGLLADFMREIMAQVANLSA
jgi:flagellar biosynthetic protein FliQ